MRRLLHVSTILLVLASSGCGPREFAGGRTAMCRLGRGASATEVLNECGIPSGLRYQPKLSEGLLRPRICSAPVYVYPGAMVAFGCSGQVSELSVGNPPSPLGIDLGIKGLESEITEGRHAEASIVGLVTLDPHNVVALDYLSRLEKREDRLAKEAASKARQIISQSK